MNKKIVLIPGTLTTSKFWSQLENQFTDRCFHHVDVLGCDSITEMALRFSRKAPDKFTLIGFSMGGYVALELFRTIPEKIEKLILINSAAKIVSEKGELERERSLELIHKGKFNFLIKLIFQKSIFDLNRQKNLLPFLQEMALEVGAENYKMQLNAILNKPDHSLLLSDISCPTLLLASEQDQIMPKERSEHLRENIKESELIYLENCGHLAILEQPNQVVEILSNWI